MVTIAYDFPLLDLIDELDATGHVSHIQHRKTHVTLHHNGGRLSHYGVLDVWRVRPASAHFNVDAAGNGAQFVRVNEYAWATGSTVGNQSSISIEMCNETLGPEWRVAEPTWRGAARLAGWLFARVIGARPTRDTLVRHKYWSATACAGPYIDTVYEQILAHAQYVYDRIVSGQSPEEDMATARENWDEPLVNPADKNQAPAWKWLLDTNAHSYHTLAEVRAMRREMNTGFQELSDDELTIVTAIQNMPTGGQVDVEHLARLLRGTLGAEMADELAARLGRPTEES